MVNHDFASVILHRLLCELPANIPGFISQSKDEHFSHELLVNFQFVSLYKCPVVDL